MELKEYLSIVRKNIRLVLVLPIISGGLAFLVSQKLPPTYTSSLTIYVKRQSTEPSGDYYTFDGYYSQQAAEKFTETVIGFLKSKDILLAAAKLAKLPTDQENLKNLERSLKVKEVAPQLVNLTVIQESAKLSEQVAASLAQAATERINLLNQTGDKAISVDLLNKQPLTERSDPPLLLNTVVGVLLGMLISYIYIFLKEYFAEGTEGSGKR